MAIGITIKKNQLECGSFGANVQAKTEISIKFCDCTIQLSVQLKEEDE
jgi:hypothetical protein